MRVFSLHQSLPIISWCRYHLSVLNSSVFFSLQPNVFTIPKESKYLYLKIDLIWKEPSAIWLSVLSKVSVKAGFGPKEVKLSSNGIVFVSCTGFKKGFPNTVSANEY